MFKRILVANRGEIALRILRACHELGVSTACVFSEEDRGAAYLVLADRAYCIGPPAPADSYLRSDRIIAAAELAGADAIHPGYGFLAENAQFADKCRASNIEFIGPSSEAMRLLGNKAAARTLAKKARVPIVPGSDGPVEDDDDEALKLAEKIGFPIMIKAAGGGGGRGMRVVREPGEFTTALAHARQEARMAFNDATVYFEAYLEAPRHVEVQVLADGQGKAIHLFERDCTMQRRHQKLIEETPSPAIDDKIRANLCKWATKLVRAAGYHSAGTVEFIGDAKGHFYFMEMNARIQVEHPVTEATSGIDLIKTQIEIAAGAPLPFTQRMIRRDGCAMEARINAEDPDENFRPCAGRIEVFRPPGGPGVRVDTHAHAGYRISPRYDSMIGKVIVHRRTRDEAIASMKRCLSEFAIEPIKTTIPLYLKILNHPDFIAGRFDTGLVDRMLAQSKEPR
ncbi:MAG: acetyl-CoA carboxylase biotin carboxylase subunit [Phycisphaerales bacterium]|nr:MAG: acetyl-CoA carboxylase biotin carboxylase subunit [Phycisphaerales bacterium]